MRYHHGDLKRALLEALPGLIEERGLEKFSLRELARRAGVTHGAPAHHFADRKGLLTAFAIEGSQHLARLVEEALAPVAATDHPTRLTAVGLGYLEFALTYPVHFRITFRPELLDLDNPELLSARTDAGATLDRVLDDAVRDGVLANADYQNVQMASWSLAHGFASLAADALAAVPADVLRRQAKQTFDYFTHRVFD